MSDYVRKYEHGINWQNYTNITTPLSASNLNGMVQGINDVDAEAARAIATKADKEETKYHVKGVSFDYETGIFTFTLQDNSTITIDTALEKVVTNFVYNYETEMLVLTLADGTTQNVDLSKLITQYEFRNSPFIAFIMGTGSGGRNKLQITATGTTTNGITYTVNADGTVTADGIATADSTFALSAAFSTTAESVLSGCPDGGGSDTYSIVYGSYSDEGEAVTIDSGESEIPTITIKSGVEVDNLVFKPMISLKTDYDVSPDFIPYLKAGEVYATLKKGSITSEYLQPDYLADVTQQKTMAVAAATLAESYAHGGTNTRTGEDNDNAKKYAENAEAWASGKRNGAAVASTDPTYHNNSEYFKEQAEAAAQTATSVITDFTGATASADGTHGLVPKPLQDAHPEKKVLRADGQWGTIEAVPNGGTTGQLLAKRSNTDGDAQWVDAPTDFTGATSQADGAKGLVPKPFISDKDKYLKGDGSWDDIEALPLGGTTGQALVKRSNTNGDAEWKSPKDMSGLENAVYSDSVSGSAPSIQDPYLKQSDVDDSLSSLSENPVQNKVVKAIVDAIKASIVPIGAVQGFLLASAPAGWLACDGGSYAVADYQALYEKLVLLPSATRETWGNADWVDYFNVPNLQGEFLRGAGTNGHSGMGNGANVGIHQIATNHPNVIGWGKTQIIVPVQYDSAGLNTFVSHTDSFSPRIANLVATATYGGSASSAENDACTYTSRPTNTSVLYCIKYR